MVAPWVYFIEIEALAKKKASSSASRRYWIAQRALDSDADSVAKPWLLEIPAEIGWQLDPLTGTVDMGGAVFLVARNATTVQWFHTLTPEPVATLATKLEPTVQTIQLNAGATGLAGTLGHIGRELVYFHTHAGAGQYTSCERGVALTQDQVHGVLPVNDVDVFAGDDWPHRKLRRVVLKKIRTDGAYGEEESVPGGEYVLRTIDQRAGGFVLTCDSYLAYAESRTFLDDRFRATGGPSNEHLGRYRADEYTLQTQVGTATAADPHLALMRFGDTAAVFPAFYSTTLAWPDGPTVREGAEVYVNTQQDQIFGGTFAPMPVAGSRPVKRKPDFPEEMHEVFVTSEQAPSNSASPDTDTLPYREHVLEFSQQVLQTTFRGNNNNTGTGVNNYDIGDGTETRLRHLGIGMPADMLDSTSFAEVTAEAPQAKQPRLWLGMENEPVEALPLLRAVCLPFGIYLAPTGDGLLGAIRLRDSLGFSTATTTITEADIVEAIEQSSGLDQAISSVEAEYNAVPGKTPNTVIVTIPQVRRRNAGQASTLSLKAHGMGSQSKVEDACLRFIDIFHLGMPKFRVTCTRSINPAPGAMVQLTSAFAVGDGSLGITNALCQVWGKWHSLQDATTRLVLAWTGFRYNRPSMYAPSAEVASRAGAALTVDANRFVGGGVASQYDDDASSFKEGDAVALLSGTDLTSVWTGRTILTVVGNVITLDADPGSGAADDVLVLDDYDAYTASTTVTEFAYFGADDDDKLGTANDDLFEQVT